MKKSNKTNLILLITVLALVVVISVTAVFAYTIIVQYNYNVATTADTLSYAVTGSAGSQVITVSQTSNSINTTKVDVVLVTATQNVTCNGQSATKTVEYTADATTYYKKVFTELSLGAINVSGGSVDVICVAPSEATITNADLTTTTVTYNNSYVASLDDLKSKNLQKHYNNMFEYFDGYFAKTAYSNFIYLLDDVTISEDWALNFPCSINLLNSTLALDGNLSVAHSYGGSYYLTNAQDNATYGLTAGSIAVGEGKKLSIRTPKAYYYVDNTVSATLNATNYEAFFNYNDYGATLITDALDFAESLIPENICNSLILQPSYQTHGVAYTYEIVSGSGENIMLTPFSGAVTTTQSEGALQRTTNTTQYTIRITATKGALTNYRDVTVNVVGSGADACLQYLADTFTANYVNQSGKLTTDDDLDLSALLRDFYLSTDFDASVTVTVDDGTSTPATDVNAVKLIVNGGTPALSCTVSHNGINLISNATTVTNFTLDCGVVVLSNSCTITFSSGAVEKSVSCDLVMGSKDEVVYFLQDNSPAFQTSANYSLLNVSDANDDTVADSISLGDTVISRSTLGLTSITYSLVTITGNVTTTVNTATYFDVSADNLTLIAPVAQTDIPADLYLKYVCTFEDSTTKEILIHIYKTASGSGGEQQFESDNPFDQLFLSSSVNWLIGGTFETPASDDNMYAKIEIITVNGEVYSSSTHKFCTITGSGNNVSGGGSTYHKTVAFTVDTNYVPTQNSVIRVKCSYYDSNATEITLEQNYIVTIPGIFKCGDNSTKPQDYTPYVFANSDFYNMTITLLENYFGNGVSSYVSVIENDVRILLSDSSYATLPLDYSTLTAPAGAVNIAGLEELTNVTSITLDGITISDLSAFGSFHNSALTSLSASNCGITDSILYGANTESYLYHIPLVTVDLSSNAISRTSNLLMRTVKNLSLASQRSNFAAVLTDIDGLSNLILMENLDVSNNGIYSFEVLTVYSNLQDAYIYGNRVEQNWTTWGTNGNINIPYYVEVTKKVGEVLHAKADALTDAISLPNENGVSALFSAGGDLTVDMQDGSLALNALVMKARLYSATEKTSVENAINNLKVYQYLGGVYSNTGTLPATATLIYSFAFYNVSTSATSNTVAFIDANHNAVTTITGTYAAPTSCTYIVVVLSNGNVVASREFTVDVYYNVA